MILSKLIEQVNVLIDDGLPSTHIVGWVNDALAEIGEEVGAVFPEADLNSDVELPIPTKWQRMLLLTYASAKAKQQDSSQFEYNDLYKHFTDNLGRFRTSYTPPNKYREIPLGTEVTLPDGSKYITDNGETLYQISIDEGVDLDTLVTDNESISFTTASSAESDVFKTPTYDWWGGSW